MQFKSTNGGGTGVRIFKNTDDFCMADFVFLQLQHLQLVKIVLKIKLFHKDILLVDEFMAEKGYDYVRYSQ